jgi:hypothetical protein
MSAPRRGRLPNSISVSWHIDDVAGARPNLTKRQCREVLQQALECHDAGIGITWEVLGIHADMLFPPDGGAFASRRKEVTP